jgi:hypothetical protein
MSDDQDEKLPPHLREIPPMARLTPREVAERWRLTPGTLSNWRNKQKGPRFIKMGDGRSSPIRYPRSAVLIYEKLNDLGPAKGKE